MSDRLIVSALKFVKAPDFMHRQIDGYPVPPNGPQRSVVIASDPAMADPENKPSPASPGPAPTTSPAGD